MPRIILECSHVDTCLSDYWGGHHKAHLQIMVYPGMSMRQIKTALRDELRQGAVMGNNECARMLSADMVKPEEEKKADSYTRAAYAAVNRLKPAKKGTRRFFLDIEEPTEESEPVYAYFVFLECNQ